MQELYVFVLVKLEHSSRALKSKRKLVHCIAHYVCFDFFQLTFRVFDSEFPEAYDEKTLTVTTDRNPTAPSCTRSNIIRAIDVNTRLNAVLDTVQANDPDVVGFKFKALL